MREWRQVELGPQCILFRKGIEETRRGEFVDGEAWLIERESPLGRRFDKRYRATAGEHWIIDAAGYLELRNNDGFIAVAKKTERE